MAKPYSYDLRYKVIAAIEQDGIKRCEASTVFQISCNKYHQPLVPAEGGHGGCSAQMASASWS